MSTFTEKVSSLIKSLNGGKKPEGEGEVVLEDEPGKEGDLEDVTDIMKALVSEIKNINKSLDNLKGSQGDLGEAVVGVAELVARIANTPLSPKSVMAKGGLGGSVGESGFPRGVQMGTDKPTRADFERAQEILIKSYKAGEISLEKSELISSDMQRAVLIPGHVMKPEHFEFLVSKMKTTV